MRKTGYLASLLNVPPLIFRFQFNPELLSDKKSFKYVPANSFGQWGFDKYSAASGFFGSIGGIADDIKEISSLLVGVKPLKPDAGGDRVISIDFKLDGSTPGPLDGDSHYDGSIEPDLAVLRSFMYPTWDIIDVGKMIFTGELKCWQKPPECSFSYGGISLTCVMENLNIKITSFYEDGRAERADVSVTLKEQPYSFSPIIDFGFRLYNVGRSYTREGFANDLGEVSGFNAISGLFE